MFVFLITLRMSRICTFLDGLALKFLLTLLIRSQLFNYKEFTRIA